MNHSAMAVLSVRSGHRSVLSQLDIFLKMGIMTHEIASRDRKDFTLIHLVTFESTSQNTALAE